MKLLDLTMHNFMPYGGEHRITFSTDASRNVAVVFGDNGRGKTSILNAVRWCLYGYALGRHLKVLDLAKMVNSDAAARGDHRMAVYLRFEANGYEYDLRRVAEPRDLVVTPRNSGDFRIDVSLRKDGRVMRGDEVEHELNQLAPEQVSRFFLFDGELLQEYEMLLTEGSEQGEKIKAAIEQVLGVPALLDGRKRLGGLLRQSQAVQAKENKHVAALRGIAEQQIQLQERLAAMSDDLKALQERERDIETEIDGLDDRLAATEAVERVKAAIDGLTSRRHLLTMREDQAKAEKTVCLRDAWRDLLQPRLELRIQELNAASDKFREVLERQGALKERARQLRKVLETSTCASCGQPMEPAKREQAGAELGRVEGELAAVDADMGRLHQVSEELTRLRRLRSTGAAARIRRVEGEIDQTLVELTDVDTKLEKLRDRIRGEDTAEIARVRVLRDQRQRNLGKVQQDIASRETEIEKQTARQNELARVMSKNTQARSQRSNREVELYGALERVFGQGIDVLRNQLRQGVAELASESFLNLSAEKSYRGLKINENYGLAIIDRDGRTVSVRSAGYEQIVALALIDALNRTARKTGPIIMDTPLGRLDPKHRASVLTEVPRMAEQVVLLVHEGEMDKVSGLEPIKSRIGATYDIVRVSSSQSKIEDARVSLP
jgi:DNA sulfur modification protein DndD